MEEISRKDLPNDYAEMMETEAHHTHKIIKDGGGVLRWAEDPFVRRFVDDCSLNSIVSGFHENNNGKNTESYRELYRKMGYSLSGYWEIFYWPMNNEIASEYAPQGDITPTLRSE